MLAVLFAILALFGGVAHAQNPPGERLRDALIVDVTDDGFRAISQALPAFVPASIDVPDVRQSGSALYRWDLDVTDMYATTTLNSAQITPGDGHLNVTAQIQLALNRAADPANVRLVYHAPWWLDGPWTMADCDFYLRPVNVNLSTRAYLSVETDGSGQRALRADIGTVDWSWNLRGSDLRVQNCWIGDINEVLELVGVSLFDLAVEPLESAVNDQIQGLVRDLGPTLEDAFNSLRIDETFEFEGSQIDVLLEPDDVQIVPQGMRLTMAGTAAAEEHVCVSRNGIDTSKSTASAAPLIGEAPEPIGTYDIGILGNDDFINQVLFAGYRAGVLCFDLEGDQGQIPLNTNLLGLLAPGAFDEFFEDPKPVRVELRPTRPPEALASGAYDVNLEASDLKLDFYTELDGRQTSVIGLDLDLLAGVDLNFDGATGELDVDVALGSDNLTASARPNEFAPGIEPEIESRIGNLFDSLVGPLVGDALGDLAFTLPSFGGFGLAGMQAQAAGPAETWFGFYADAGLVPYGSGGCNDSGGCDDGSDGCAQGCNPVAASGRGLTLVLLPLIVALLRRRATR